MRLWMGGVEGHGGVSGWLVDAGLKASGRLR